MIIYCTFIRLSTNGAYGITISSGIVAPVAVENNQFSGTWAVAKVVFNSSIPVFRDVTTGLTVATLPAVANGSQVFVTDGTPGSSPCTGSGTGSLAIRQNGAWKCL